METWNVKELLESHEWDEDRSERIKSLVEKINKDKEVEPLIMINCKDGSGFVIDGWHRLLILYKSGLNIDPNMPVIKFMAYMVTQEEANMFPAPKMRKKA